jgi:subtilase family serine protease
MQRSWIPRPTYVLISFVFLAVIASAQQPQDRILQSIDEGQKMALRGNVHPLAKPEFDRGQLNPSEVIEGITLNFKLSDSQQAALEKLVAQQHNPNSPNYHKWLTPEQYAARFGMSQGDLDRATTWLQSQGFTGIRVSRSRTRLSFTGSAARVESAFHTELHQYEVNSETHFANASEPALPAALANTVLGVGHLNNFAPRPRAHGSKVSARFTSYQTGNHFLTPGDFATIYNLKPLYDDGIDGTGITIAVIGQTQIATSGTSTFSMADISTFRSLSGLSSSLPTVQQTPGTGTAMSCSGDADEAAVDVEWSGAVAKGATILYDFAGVGTSCTGGACTCTNRSQNAFNALIDAVDNKRAPIISLSYGNCEANIGSTDAQSLRQLAQQADSQGQTIAAATGDAGAADCEDTTSTSATTGLAVDMPASIPEVVAVGGTEFTGDAAGGVTGTSPNTNASATTYWGATTNSTDNVSSALKYIPETSWNDTTASIAGGQGLSATGGGVSTFFTKPSWQTALTPGDGHRDVPDVSLSGSPAHDAYLICSSGWCSSTSFRSSSNNGQLDAIGGTSVSSQVFGGIVALINQATESSGLGNINPTLYSLRTSTPSAFNDIASGNNKVPCTSGSTGCPSGTTSIGFSAGTGYDMVTGLGSIDANALITAWPGFVTIPSYAVSGTAVTIASPGNTGTSTITVSSSSGFTGTVNLACALSPPSTTAGVTCAFTAPTSGSTTSVSLSGSTTSATATMSVATTAAHAQKTPNAASKQRPSGWFIASGGSLAAGLFLISFPSRRRWAGLLGLMFCVFLAAGMGCGGGSSSSSSGSTTSGGTPTGSYTIAVTATSGNITHTGNVTVTVQ